MDSLVAKLRERSLHVKYDGDLDLGEDLGHFMATSILAATRVLLICTPKYVAKANGMEGGVGHESSVITAELLHRQRTNRFVPVIRIRDGSPRVMPAFMASRNYANLEQGARYDAELEKLIQSLLCSEHSPGSEPSDDYSVERSSDGVISHPRVQFPTASQISQDTAVFNKIRTFLSYEKIVSIWRCSYGHSDDIKQEYVQTLGNFMDYCIDPMNSFIEPELEALRIKMFGHTQKLYWGMTNFLSLWSRKSTSLERLNELAGEQEKQAEALQNEYRNLVTLAKKILPLNRE